MKLITYERGVERRIGALVDGHVVDLCRAYSFLLMERGVGRAAQRAALLLPQDMVELLDGGEESLAAARAAVARVGERLSSSAEALRREGLLYELAEVTLCAPLPRPRKLLLLGFNYRGHAVESGGGEPEQPVLLTKFPSVVIGPGAPIRMPRFTQRLDWEAELAVVIGRGGRDIPAERAYEHIVGYTLLNDVSAREVHRERGQWLLNKSLDTFAPLGPWLVTKDEVGEPQNLRIQGFLNGMAIQDSNTRQMIFPIDRIVSFISERFTLEPGDVISTGTPEGVGGMRNPPIFLKPGDVVQVVVEKIGTLENPVSGAPW
ncbi:MAG: fumarylacetoacetate hydrolase family protein [Candidatus Tectomicrobia bacterium]|nr:fumarylacetoacetate hydrolase family protein [Candidatus Tectomicrobia bacterium]